MKRATDLLFTILYILLAVDLAKAADKRYELNKQCRVRIDSVELSKSCEPVSPDTCYVKKFKARYHCEETWQPATPKATPETATVSTSRYVLHYGHNVIYCHDGHDLDEYLDKAHIDGVPDSQITIELTTKESN